MSPHIAGKCTNGVIDEIEIFKPPEKEQQDAYARQHDSFLLFFCLLFFDGNASEIGKNCADQQQQHEIAAQAGVETVACNQQKHPAEAVGNQIIHKNDCCEKQEKFN